MKSNELNGIKREILDTCYRTREGHVASSFSILDILDVLYGEVLKNSPVDTKNDCRDRFILSKGHAAIGYYAILHHYGYFNNPLNSMCMYGSSLGGHPDSNKINGVEVSTGSLGHGLPMAVGIALGLKIQNNNAHVFCLIGDGEINEGSIWESLMIANHQKLSNLTVIVDYNHSTDRAVDVSCLSSKLSSFGMDVLEIDGHNHDEIKKALLYRSDRTTAIVANTIKGKGISEMINNPAWHHRVPTEDEYNRFMEELI